jgi:ATP/ADP translocase
MTFMTQYSALVGIGSTVMMLIGSNLLSSLGWRVGALSTPGQLLPPPAFLPHSGCSSVVMSLVALPFYLSIFFSKYLKTPNALLIPVYIGLLQNVLSKVCFLSPAINDRLLTHPPPCFFF